MIQNSCAHFDQPTFFLNTQFVVHSFKIFGLGFKDMTKDGGIWVNTLM